MKRIFADLHIRLNSKDKAHTQRIARKLAELGYKLVAPQLSIEVKPEEALEFKSAFTDEDLDFVSRVDLRPRSPDELLNLLRKLRRKFEIICVLCENKEVARQAAKDRRVDLLNFPLLDYRRRFFDRAEAALASGGSAGFEVDIKPLLVLDGAARVRFLSSLRREVAIAMEFRLPIVVSSGVSELMFLRRPREVAILSSLFGLTGNSALDSVSQDPVRIVERNRGKLGTGFVAPGIRVIKQGGDY
jgi:RNase P/RNase MRP subunit p30